MSALPARRYPERVEKPQTFRSATAVVVWVVWLLFAVGNWIDLAVQGRDHTSAVAAAILVLVTGVAYVTAQRPRIISDEAGVTVRNPLRDHRVAWACVTNVDLADLLRVHCAWGGPPGAAPADREHHKVINAWAIHYSRRRQFAAEARARRRRPGASALVPGASRRPRPALRRPRGPAPPPPRPKREIVRPLSGATAAQAEAAWANSAAEPPAAEPPAAGTEPAAETSAAAGTGPSRTWTPAIAARSSPRCPADRILV